MWAVQSALEVGLSVGVSLGESDGRAVGDAEGDSDGTAVGRDVAHTPLAAPGPVHTLRDILNAFSSVHWPVFAARFCCITGGVGTSVAPLYPIRAYGSLYPN